MNQEIKAKWLEALRSGRYTQGEGVLHDMSTGQFCCLGVLCDVIDPDWKSPGDEGKAVAHHQFGDSNKFLDPTFCEEIGIDSDTQDKLTKMNDGENGVKYDFAQIADWIEQNL